jgi:acyl carrier protein
MDRREIQTLVRTMVGELYAQSGDCPIADNLSVLGPEGLLDSVLGLQLLLKIEERFGIVVQDEEIDGENLASLARISRFIESKLAID